MQSYNISFKGQNIYVGIDVHLRTWTITVLAETGYKRLLRSLLIQKRSLNI